MLPFWSSPFYLKEVAQDLRQLASRVETVSYTHLDVYKRQDLQPLFYGGRHERSRRAGTENVPGIVALGKAAELAMQAFVRGDDRKMSRCV